MNFFEWILFEANWQLGWRAVSFVSDWVKSLFFLCGGLIVAGFMVMMILLAVRNASKDRSDSSSE